MNDYPTQKLEKSWIEKGINPEIVEWTKSFGKYLCAFVEEEKPQNLCAFEEEKPQKKALTTGQLRKFFGEIKRIEADVLKHKADIAMLKPLLAYAVGRDKKKGKGKMENKTRIDDFEKEISAAIDAIRLNSSDDILKSDYRNFVQIFESIVAYHKYYGGQENSNN